MIFLFSLSSGKGSLQYMYYTNPVCFEYSKKSPFYGEGECITEVTIIYNF